MDTTSNHTQASSSTSETNQPELRTSARVKAAKQKARDKADDSEQSTTAQPQTRSKPKRSNKNKSKDTSESAATRPSKRARRNIPAAQPALSINEPVSDPKGKKRAVPEPSSDDDPTAGSSPKRIRTTSYSLRSSTTTVKDSTTEMPKKSRSAAKGKQPAKSKAMTAAGSSKIEDEDVEMMDAEMKDDNENEDGDGGNEETGDVAMNEDQLNHDDDDDDDDDDGDDGDGGGPLGTGGSPPIPGGLDESAALAIFGDYHQFGSYMMSLSSRLKTMLNNIKPTADPTTRLLTLQELSELLSMSTEDTLAGSFQVEQFVKELVKILGGRGNDEDEDEDGDGDDGGGQDEDAALAAALAISGGGYQGDENLEAQVLACRCLANLMEALPGVAHTVVYHGAIPVLCSKLIEISYIDLAEQTLSTMEKISEEFPSAIVRENGLSALLNYLDFFSIAVQRTAIQAASNCCRNVSPEHSKQIREVWPIIRNCLSYSDQRLVEFACMCVIRAIDSYHRSSVENLELLVDADLIRAVNQLLIPAGAPLVTPNTYTLLVRALGTAARASPKITIALLEADIVDTTYQILTGVLPSASAAAEQGSASGGQGLGGGLADMTVMENLAHRPKDQIEETLSLVSELLPPLPKDGVFDHKSYTEKALGRMIKAKAKAERAAARQAVQESLAAAMLIDSAPLASESSKPTSSSASQDDTMSAETAVAETEEHVGGIVPAPDRTDMLRSKPAVVDRFMDLMVPILIDVYAASVITPVRVKTLTGLLKAVSFLDADGLKRVLRFVPVASFASSILSSKDHPTLVIGALQIVDMLLAKIPTLYKPAFKREGVFHEIETLSSRTIVSSKSKDKESKEKMTDNSDSAVPSSDDTPPPPTASTSSAISMAATLPGFKKLSSLQLEPEDAITLRARVIQFRYLAGDDKADGEGSFSVLQSLVTRLTVDGTESEATQVLHDLADLFDATMSTVSSFELLQSGLVDSLLSFATDAERKLSVSRRKELLLDAFTARNRTGAFATFVKKLQESLTRMESFEVVSVGQGTDDSKRSSPSLLARQLRLRLVAEDDSDIPRNLHNIVVSIHAIATFQALHDYLRPRVSGLLSGGSRLSGMLAALAASGFGAASSSRTPADEAPPTSTSNGAAASTSSGSSSADSGSTVTRRRSQRLSAKKGSTSETPADPIEADPQTESSAEPSDTAAAGPSSGPFPVAEDSGLAAEFTDDEDEDLGVFDDEADPDNSIADKTVTLSIAEDGSKVEAQTPDGTRVATPREAPASRPSPARPSYAAALKAKPTDWHLEFSMDDQTLPLDLTIYGAMHQHEIRKKTGALPPNLIWQGVYTIKFKKVTGPAPSAADPRTDVGECSSKGRSLSPTLSSLPEDAPHAKILRLLRVLHQINMLETERSAFAGERRDLPESAFVNNKLTAKLTRQLEEPMIVASSCLPDWALDLPQHFPFLFPFTTRYNFLQSTSFGYARLIQKWQSQQTRTQDSSRRDDGIGFLGRLQRQKVRISRKHILESAVKVFELYGSSSSVLEVEYFEEVGTGLGPTLEFYSLVSREFARKDLKLWRDADASGIGAYVSHPSGLYPAPLNTQDLSNDGVQKRTHIYRIIGQFVAKAMLDSRIIDLSLNKIFLKIVLGEEVPLTIATLKLVDISLANSLEKIQNIVAAGPVPEDDKLKRKVALIETVSIDDLALDFTIPGYDIELRPGGCDTAVTKDNVDEYIYEVLEAIIGQGVQLQAKAFREGFSKVFPITDLQAFSADELVLLFGNSDEDWSPEMLSEAVKADHGFNGESRAIRDLLDIMSEYDVKTRRSFLQFVSGSPKLPIGGFRGLNPALTVVRKPHEAPLTADDYLPSVMTCVNYLKLPEYSTRDVMREKLRVAMSEGGGSFHLS